MVEFSNGLLNADKEAILEKLSEIGYFPNHFETRLLITDLDLGNPKQLPQRFQQLVNYSVLSQPFTKFIDSCSPHLLALMKQIDCNIKKVGITHEKLFEEMLARSTIEIEREQFIQIIIAKTDIHYLEDTQKLFEYLDYTKAKSVSRTILIETFEALFVRALSNIAFVDFDLTLKTELSGLFPKIDLNGDGTISIEEMHTALKACNPAITTEQTKEIVAAADMNKNGKIEIDEFISMMLPKIKEMLSSSSDSMCDLLCEFRSVDKENKGYFTSATL
jgi:Ca2+-binding EF-hand superfamily protein